MVEWYERNSDTVPYNTNLNDTQKEAEQKKYETLLTSIVKSANSSDGNSFDMVFVAFEDDRMWGIQHLHPYGLVAAACEFTTPDECEGTNMCLRKWKLTSDGTRDTTEQPLSKNPLYRPTKRYLRTHEIIFTFVDCLYQKQTMVYSG